MLRRADVAKMLPCVPAAITASDGTNTIKSVSKTSRKEVEKVVIVGADYAVLTGRRGRRVPMTQKGFLANLSLPCHPRYLQQQPAAQILMKYSSPNTTIITNSWKSHTCTHVQHPRERGV